MMKVLAYEGISLISKAIRWQTDYAVSHVALEMSDGTVWEAWHKDGVIKRKDYKEGHTPGTRIRVYEFVSEDVDESKALKFLQAHEGDRYDWQNVWRFIPRWGRKPNDSWFCSELVSKACIKAGVPLQNEACDKLSPRDVCISRVLAWPRRQRVVV